MNREQKERREIKRKLMRKLNQRTTVNEFRNRDILWHCNDYVGVVKVKRYQRRPCHPWTRILAAKKMAMHEEFIE